MIRMFKKGTLSPASRPFLPSSSRQHPFRLPVRPEFDYHRILDPGSEIVIQWNKIFLVSGLVALFIDPLYFYLPSFIPSSACLDSDIGLGIAVTFFRCCADLFYLAHMLMKFRTAFISPSSRVFGRGELVMDEREIAARYLRKDFFLDLAAMLPLPQASFTWKQKQK
ncbi:Cyclic nucleotide-gated ion channel 18 [Asimina triloba]